MTAFLEMGENAIADDRLANCGQAIKIESALVGYRLQLQRLNLGFSLL